MMATMAWYKEWFGEEYLGLYSHRDEQEAEAHIDFVERVLGEPRPRAVLDLACGAGRHTAVLRRRGYRTLGVDLSLTLLAHARRLPCVAGDMRCLPFRAGGFDWVLNFFTSFGYFETERENFQVLEEIVRVLAPCGRFLIDIMNTANTLRHLQPREVQRLDGRRQEAAGREQAAAPAAPGAPGGKRPAAKTASGPHAPEGRTVEIERWYDAATKRINKRIRVQAAGGGGIPRAFLESVRAYQPEEVTIGLHWAGLEVTGLYGNFQGDPYGSDSERLILVGWKPA
ncbi:MAG TPA: class I SAM-dependent methyltransferase [Thermoanaerobaculia bacterium]|nr:class I SAM-dependent methyltransferase [Thermoanaerobaculia bacterium]